MAALAAYLQKTRSSNMNVEQRKKIVYQQYRDDSWQKLGKPETGDWLESFPEEGQTLEEFKKDATNRKTSSRFRIYLLPLGGTKEEQPEVLEYMREYAEIFFSCETIILNSIPLPQDTYNKERGQYNGSEILDGLIASVPKDALAVAAITIEDLYVPKLNFVFGVASLSQRVGVYSLARYKQGGADEKIFLRRSINVMAHETGHMFGISHCVFYDCVMCGSNSLKESDLRSSFLCPLCLDKLKWLLRFDIIKRYEKLDAFYREHGLKEEADFIKKRVEYLLSGPK
jgi:archaemetzincin